MPHPNREIRQMIDKELDKYLVGWNYGDNAKSCFVEITTPEGSRDRVPFSPTASGHSILNVRSNIRQALKRMDAKPIPCRKAQTRISPLGEKLMEAATNLAVPGRDIEVDMTSQPEPENYDWAPCKPANNPVSVASASPETETKEAEMSTPTLSNNVTPINGAQHKIEAAKAAEPEFLKLRQGEIVQATQLILFNADIDHGTKTVVYKTDWSDARIAKILAAAPDRERLTANHIRVMRREYIGLTPEEHEAQRLRDKPPTIDGLWTYVKDLEARLQALEDAATAP